MRQSPKKDVEGILSLSKKIYPDQFYTRAEIIGQLNNFPEGQFVAIYEEKVVGYCASIRVSERRARRKHSWVQITGDGFCTTHDPDGEFLYGVDVFVDPKLRGIRVGDRFYRERIKLCRHYHLRGIAFGGRLPMYSKRKRNYKTPLEYIEAVREKEIRDPAVSFHFRQGFEVLGVLEDYLPEDKDSLGFAAHFIWYNPEVIESPKKQGEGSLERKPDTVRVATVQYKQRQISSFEEFEQIVSYFVEVVGEYKADFVTFPEFFTLQLLSIENEEVPANEAIDHLTRYTPKLIKLFSELAIRHNVNIIAGSHPTKTDDGDIRNVCYVCLRDGSVHEQAKIHPTPDEEYWWNIEGGDHVEAIETDCGPIGVLICYDSEFPELARHLANQGALLLFVPFCTDERQGYLRVRYCCQARAVENQMYVVMSGNVGNLPRVSNMDIQYAQSCILTPCDFRFSRDGIASDTTPNVETVAFADLRLEHLHRARHSGSVRNFKDRRHDLYRVIWRPRKAKGAEK